MKLTSGTTGSAYIASKESLSEVLRYEFRQHKAAYSRPKHFKKLQVERHQLRTCVSVIVLVRIHHTDNTVVAILSRST